MRERVQVFSTYMELYKLQTDLCGPNKNALLEYSTSTSTTNFDFQKFPLVTTSWKSKFSLETDINSRTSKITVSTVFITVSTMVPFHKCCKTFVKIMTLSKMKFAAHDVITQIFINYL